ncbi:MAG: hypothetical protein JRI95_08205 [Deltaproteobacteria bacterium]|nr:hypothetical protein [Deltaproteobacteria bacterium]MBW2084924.1 hypothetical protein [Deltaproteobacteria bacterium]
MGEQVRPANIIPVIFVRGSNYEMGYQYGYQMAGGIKRVRDQQMGNLKLMVNNNFEIWKQCLKGFQYYIKEYTPEIIDEMIGIAAGATDAGYDISYMDILTINVSVCMKSAFSPGATLPSPLDELPPREYQEKYGLKSEESDDHAQADQGLPEGLTSPKDSGGGCSRWAAWGSATKDGSLICGDSVDGFFGDQVNIIAFPEEGNAFISGALMCGELTLHPLMNNKGLWVSGGNIDTPRDIDRNYGIPLTLALRHLGQFYDNAEEAKEKLLSYQTTGGRVHNAMVADTTGNAYIFELTAALKTYRKPGDFGEADWIASPNTYLIPENQKLFEPELQPFKTDPRVVQLWAFFDKYKGQIDANFGKMLYRYHDPDEDTYYIGNRFNQRVNIGIPNNGSGGVFYQATGPAGRSVVAGRTPQDHLDVTHTFYTLRLKSSPGTVLREAQLNTADCMAKTDYTLKKLNLEIENLPAYLKLKEMFSSATEEYMDGRQFQIKAGVAEGNEKLYFMGKALTSYVRAESKYREIYNYIHPSADKPEDLGLDPIEPPRPAMKVYEEMNVREIMTEGI